MTKKELIERLENIRQEARKSKDKEVVLASGIISALLGALQLSKTGVLSGYAAQFSKTIILEVSEPKGVQ